MLSEKSLSPRFLPWLDAGLASERLTAMMYYLTTCHPVITVCIAKAKFPKPLQAGSPQELEKGNSLEEEDQNHM